MTSRPTCDSRPRIQTRFHAGIQPIALRPNHLLALPRAGLRGYCIDRVGAQAGYDLSPTDEAFDPCPSRLIQWQPRVREGPQHEHRPLLSRQPTDEADLADVSTITMEATPIKKIRNPKRARDSDEFLGLPRSSSYSASNPSPISRKKIRRLRSYSDVGISDERDIADGHEIDEDVKKTGSSFTKSISKRRWSFEINLRIRRKSIRRPNDILTRFPNLV